MLLFSDSRTRINGDKEEDIRLMDEWERHLMEFLVNDVLDQKLNDHIQGPAES